MKHFIPTGSSLSLMKITLVPYYNQNLTFADVYLLSWSQQFMFNVTKIKTAINPQPTVPSWMAMQNISDDYFQLINNTLYDISIYITACPGTITSTFAYGKINLYKTVT